MTSPEAQILTCPCCGGELLFDPESGSLAVLTPPPGGEAAAHQASAEGSEDRSPEPISLQEVQDRMAAREKSRKDAFGDALQAERGRKNELDDLFRKANEKIEDVGDDGDGKPDNPLDDKWR